MISDSFMANTSHPSDFIPTLSSKSIPARLGKPWPSGDQRTRWDELDLGLFWGVARHFNWRTWDKWQYLNIRVPKKLYTDLGPCLAFQQSIIWSHINLAVIRRLLGPPFHQSPTQQLGLTLGAVSHRQKWKRNFCLQGQKPAGFSDFCEVDELLVQGFFVFEIPAEGLCKMLAWLQAPPFLWVMRRLFLALLGWIFHDI